VVVYNVSTWHDVRWTMEKVESGDKHALVQGESDRYSLTEPASMKARLGYLKLRRFTACGMDADVAWWRFISWQSQAAYCHLHRASSGKDTFQCVYRVVALGFRASYQTRNGVESSE